MKKPASHGGARKGAGRPRAATAPIQLKLSREIIQMLREESERGGHTMSSLAEDCIRRGWNVIGGKDEG